MMAHNAQVSKLCDLAENGNDTISSVSWVQKVRFTRLISRHIVLIYPSLCRTHPCSRYPLRSSPHLRRKHPATPTHVPTSASPTHRCTRMELLGSLLGLTRPHSTPPRCPRFLLTSIQTLYRTSPRSLRVKMEW
jgi:hypothetical protein